MNRINLDQLARDAVKSTLPFLADLNREQLRQGQDANGLIRPQYRPHYGARKRRLSTYRAPFPTPDLYLTGKYHKRIKAFLSGTVYKIYSEDSKRGLLEEKYGEDIHRLGPASIEKAKPEVTRNMGASFKRQTGL